jgi:hypothetical protein
MTRKLADFHKRRIASTMRLRKSASLNRVMEQIEGATQQFWRDYDARESRYENIELIEEENALKLTQRHHRSKGRPRKTALRTYASALAIIYKRATGKKLGRINVEVPDSSSNGSHTEERPNPFVGACMKAAGSEYYRSRFVVRKGLEDASRS